MLLEDAKKYLSYIDQIGEGKKYSKQQDVATALGITIYSFKSRLKQARSLIALHEAGHKIPGQHFDHNSPDPNEKFAVPFVPSEEMELPELLEHLVKRYKKRDIAKKQSNWVEVKVKFNEPFMLVLVGDPHVYYNY